MLKELLGSTSEEVFFHEYWNQQGLVLRQSKIFNYCLFKKNDFFRLLKNNNFDFPTVTCMNDKGRIPIEKYVDITTNYISTKIIGERVINLAANGNTVRVRAIDQFNDNIDLLRKKMMGIFRFNVTANAYYSSYPAEGITPHYDIRHTFIVQLDGSKEWSIGNKINQTPRHDFRPFNSVKYYDKKETFILNAGEILYVPPGLWHQTRTIDQNYSLHLALGVTTADWYDMFRVYLTHLMKKYPIFREHIPFTIKDGKLSFSEDIQSNLLPLIELMKNEVADFDFYEGIEEEVANKPVN